MSKYTEAISEKESFIMRCESSLDYNFGNESLFLAKRQELEDARIDLEALQIADKFEQADAISNEEIYIKACRRYGCWESECPYRARDRFCPDLAEIFFDGYAQGLDDIRGEE